jgi:two-component system NtrC family sensor kinase
MLLLLSVAGLSAIYSYWSLIGDLRFRRDNEPQHAELLAEMSKLVQPFIHVQKRAGDPFWKTADEHPPAEQNRSPDNLVSQLKIKLIFDEALWSERRLKAREALTEYYRRGSDISATDKKTWFSLTLPSLDQIKLRMDRLDVLDHRRRSANVSDPLIIEMMFLQANEILVLVQQMPVHESRIESTLRGSHDEIEWRLWMIGCPTAIVVALFFSLIYFGYHWILIPIRKLHEAASRVANGDYSYRLKLRGRDEMVDLAEMFNKMTARFQTDKARLAKEVEERSRQLLRNERLAGIGFFASGISHEINNPLQAIGAAAESLNSRISDGSLGSELPSDDRELLTTYLGMIEREAGRCQQITSRVLDFARGTNGPRTRQDLTKIVAEVLDMVSHMSKFDNYKIVFDRRTPHYLDVSAAEMKQVILNLVANGLEAMPGSGTMNISITESFDEVLLTIQDHGCGMTPEVIANLYEPFFTDKLNGKGTGLGLSITHRIVGDHGGRIEATSDGVGQGSTFHVHLPRCVQQVNTSAA